MDTLNELLEEIKGVLTPTASLSESAFTRLAYRLLSLHYDQNPYYHNLVVNRTLSRDEDGWRSIPCLPIRMFKVRDVGLMSFTKESMVERVFRSSGTTSENKSKHLMFTTDLYEASLTAAFQSFVLGRLPWTPGYTVVILQPPMEQSSLDFMFQMLSDELGDMRSFRWYSGEITQMIKKVDDNPSPVLVLGTTLAFWDVHTKLQSRAIPGRTGTHLPPLSCIVETGGLKKLQGEISDDPLKLASDFSSDWGINTTQHRWEYSMSEMSSQLYATYCDNDDRPQYESMPWLKYRVVDPFTKEDMPIGEEGVIQFFDLANVWSCPFIETEDVGHITHDGKLVLHGRAQGAVAKGCSMSFEEVMSKL